MRQLMLRIGAALAVVLSMLSAAPPAQAYGDRPCINQYRVVEYTGIYEDSKFANFNPGSVNRLYVGDTVLSEGRSTDGSAIQVDGIIREDGTWVGVPSTSWDRDWARSRMLVQIEDLCFAPGWRWGQG